MRSYTVPWLSKGCWVVHVFQLAPKGREWKVQLGFQRSIICLLSVRLYTSSETERRRRKGSKGIILGWNCAARIFEVNTRAVCSCCWDVYCVFISDNYFTLSWKTNTKQVANISLKLHKRSRCIFLRFRYVGVCVCFFISYSEPAIVRKYAVQTLADVQSNQRCYAKKRREKKAWPRNVYRLLFWLYNNAVVCGCLTRGRARIPFSPNFHFIFIERSLHSSGDT